MTAAEVAARLGGKRCGEGYIVRCPAHADRNPSLSVRDGRVGLLVTCFAGCDRRDVLAALRMLPSIAELSARGVAMRGPPSRSFVQRQMTAARLWDAALPLPGTLADRYLTSRGLSGRDTAALRFLPALRHITGTTWPALIAKVVNAKGTLVGVHRTFLALDGSGKASVPDNKLMLGPCGGGAVRLRDPDSGYLMIAEGIETSLAATHGSGRPAWAALSAAGLVAVQLPTSIRKVLILADGDPAGARAAEAACRRLRSEGRVVEIANPPMGQDFADVWLATGIVELP